MFNIEKSIQTLDALLASGQLEPFIKHIRFPIYKKISPDTKLEFNFPISVIVGKNGTNKSSILHALYGAPRGSNVGDFWFETATDKIDEQSCFIYGYFAPISKVDVEIIKKRIQRTYPDSDKINPDYWEPSRPVLMHGMKKMPPTVGKLLEDRTKTRWNPIEKNVVYLDFRSEISAFDKCLYHNELPRDKKQWYYSKQHFLRERSKHLKISIDNNSTTHTFYTRKAKSNRVLSNEELDYISRILGKKYSKIQIVMHDFFDDNGISALLQTEGLNYTEAYAGSGEYAVVKLVSEIFNAKPKSLILLDEPEVSLHPGAQKRLMQFLLDMVKINKHQIIMGTHSPFFVKGMPNKAIKVLYENPSTHKINVINQASEVEAFFQVESEQEKDFTIFVEDPLAQKIVTNIIKGFGEAAYKAVNVRFMPGGASVLLTKYLPSIAALDINNTFFILDGDQRYEAIIPSTAQLNTLNLDSLLSLTKDVLHGEPDCHVDGHNGQSNPEQKQQLIKKYLIFAKENLAFLPSSTPEALIWESTPELKETNLLENNDYKMAFQKLTMQTLNKATYETVSAEEILFIQETYLGKLDDNIFDDLRNFLAKKLGYPI